MTAPTPQDDREIFLRGTIVNLCIPDVDRDVRNGHWHRWFNDMDVTRYLIHGVMPVSRDTEAAIIERELGHSDSLLLTVVEIRTGRHIGVISLKSIDHLNRRAEIGLVMGPYPIVGAALEAMALLTAHGFDRLNLQKIYAGQHESLWQWLNTIALIGYRLEGYRADYGFRNGQSYGIALTGASAAEFQHLRETRGGNILGPSIEKLLNERRKENLVERVKSALASVHT